MNERQVGILRGHMPDVRSGRWRKFFWDRYHADDEASWVYQGARSTLPWATAHSFSDFEDFEEDRQRFWEYLQDPRYFNLG